MKSLIRYLFIIFSLTVGVNQTSSQCVIGADFNDYLVNGMSSTIQWQPQSQNEVICYSSDWQPSFFVNQDSLLNVKITGELYIDSSHGDDDYVGFVFGYKSPTFGTEANDNRFYLFDWKKVGQHAPDEFGGFLAKEGFSLVYTDGLIPGDPINTYRHFWGHEEGENFKILQEDYGNNKGWEYNTTYFFELVYAHNQISIRINGEEIFNLDGCFHPGLFGLYTFNQNGVVYQNLNIEQMYDIQFSTDEEFYCEEIPINFSFIDTTCSEVPPSLQDFEWYFGDESNPLDELNPVHSFYDPGPYDVELRITNTEGCVDTLTRFVFIEPKPQFLEHPVDQICYVGDRVDFSIEAVYAETFQWYFQTTDMTYWSKVQNNGYFSGANTPNLTVYNVRPNFDHMKLRCQVNGKCYNLVTSQYAEISISEIPVRAYVNSTEDQICSKDSTIFTVRLQEPYQIDRANLRLLFDSASFKFTDYTTYLQNMTFDFQSGSNYVDIGINVINPINLDEVIIASLNFTSIANFNANPGFSFDAQNTYFVNENQDTIFQYLYGSDIHIYQPIGAGLQDSINMCRGEQLSLDPDQFSSILWSTGQSSSSIVPQNEGLLYVMLEDLNHCQSVDTFYLELDEQPKPPFSIGIDQDYYCSFEDSIVVVIKGGEGNCLKLNYELSEILDSFPEALNYQIPNPGNSFDVKASWMNFCGESAEILRTVDVYPEAEPAIHLYSNHDGLELGDMVTVYAEIVDEGSTPNLLWYIDDKLVQMGPENSFSTNELSESQKLEVMLFSNEKCILGSSTAKDQIQIDLKSTSELYIPAIVSPNGDGFDDSFRIFFKNNNLDFFELQIFDIRGRLLFTTLNQDKEWTGENTLNSGGLEVLTYFLRYKYSNSLEKTISGKFLLKK